MGKPSQPAGRRILLLTKYPRMAASSRLRTYQYLPFWHSQFDRVKVSPLLNEQYLSELYSGKAISWLNVFGCFLKRAYELLFSYRYDLIWIEKELFPYLPAFAEWILSKSKGFVVDYDDAIFHNYDHSHNSLVRQFLSKKIANVMRLADMVWVGSPYLKDYAKHANAKRIVYLPTCIVPNRYRLKLHSNPPSICIGWIGSPTTQKYLVQILPVLESLHRKYAVKLLVVNGSEMLPFSGDVETISWTEQGEVDAILRMDIGIMPLPDSAWERGKCAYKLIQYMACGIPVVASPVGVNATVVAHGVNGYLAKTHQEWENYLGDLIIHLDKRISMGNQGHHQVMASYTMEKNIARIQQGLEALP
jgi:glycosyltransferase involved in cell wall biosynthesis